MAEQRVKIAVPTLRFPEFLGITDWCVKPMNELYSFMRNNVLSRDKLNYEQGRAKNIHYGDIHTKFPAIFDITKEYVPFINESEAIPDAGSEDYCVEGDLVFADASEDTNDVGKCMEIVRLSGQRLLAGQHTILARRKGDALAVGFAGYLFQSGLIRSRIEKEAQGTKVYQISSSRLDRIEIIFPESKGEQQKIADCLTSLDELIASQGRKLEVLKAHKRGLMKQLFPREGETRPRLRFPEFRDAPEWKNTSLDRLAKRGSGHTPSKSKKVNYDGGIKWVSLADSRRLDRGLISETTVEISEKGIANSSAVMHPAGSVVLCRDAGIGKSAIMAESMAVSQHFMVWSCDEKLLSNWYLYYLLKLMRPLFEDVASGSTIKTIGLSFFKELSVITPSLSEQQRIADCLSSLDTQITAESDQLAALKSHKQGLMQQLFPAQGAG